MLVAKMKLPIMFYCTTSTCTVVQNYIKTYKTKVASSHNKVEDLHDFIDFAYHIEQDEILILVLARIGSVSYKNYMTKLIT